MGRRAATGWTCRAMLVVALAAGGCDGEAPSAEAVRVHLEQSIPGAEFRRESRVRLGRFTLGLAKGAMRLVAFEDRQTRRALSQVRSIDIASYEVLSLPTDPDVTLPPRFERRLAAAGWYPMVATREDDSHSWIFVREPEPGEITNLYIVELDAFELTVIDLQGRLDRVVAQLVADDSDGFLADVGG